MDNTDPATRQFDDATPTQANLSKFHGGLLKSRHGISVMVA